MAGPQLRWTHRVPSSGRSRVAAGLLSVLFLVACEDSFTAIEPGDQQLSVYGYLDPSADTQWIRVSIMRSTVFTAPDSAPVRVTLQSLGDNQVIGLRQETVRFSGTAGVDSAGITAHNFWTTEPIQPGATYRLRAEPATGKTAGVDVAIPSDFVMDVDIKQSWVSGSDSLRLTGLKHVAFVSATSQYYYKTCPSITETRSFAAPHSDTLRATRFISIAKTISGAPGCGTVFVPRRTLWVVGSGGDWPSGGGSVNKLGGPGATNISNGVGFVGGVLTRSVPYENCEYVRATGTNLICRLHYDATTASLSGTVSDPRCGWNVQRASVKLVELDPVAPEVAKIRSTVTDTAGGYWIGALVPGMHYTLTVHRDEWQPGNLVAEYDDYTATLLFTAGEQAKHDLVLQRGIFPCPTN